MSDNSTAHSASDYEREVRVTVPFHATILDQALDTAFAFIPNPTRWLDTGWRPRKARGAGQEARSRGHLRPRHSSEAMLDFRARAQPGLPAFLPSVAASSDALPDSASFEIITAIQCHHYYEDPGGRERALRRCRALLAPGGAMVISSTCAPRPELGHALLQRRRWAAWQRAQGRIGGYGGDADRPGRDGASSFPSR